MTPRWVAWLFRAAAVYGVCALVPLYFAVPALARAGQPVNHREFLFGFAGTALAFQLVYWVIGGSPSRYRPLMAIAVLAKLSFFVPCVLLFMQGALPASTMGFASADLFLAIGFFAAWHATPHDLKGGAPPP